MASPLLRFAAPLLVVLVGPTHARPSFQLDPLVEEAYLKASNTGPVDLFGCSVAASGDTVVVGAPGESSRTTGINGNELDDGAPFAGAAYVFVRSGNQWVQQAYLKASNTDAGDLFGHSVAIDGDTIVVTARFEGSGATGVNGNQGDNGSPSAGAAYVFVRTGTTWSQQAYLKASNTDALDQFGRSVGICGDTIVVGARNEASRATGVNGDPSDNSMPGAGAVYVFVRQGTTWSQQAYLKASNTDPMDYFGRAVDIAGDTLVVGAPDEDSSATGIGGNQLDNSSPEAGAAYVFTRTGSTWAQQAYLKASNTDARDLFGIQLDVSGDTVLIGASGEDGSSRGIGGNQADNGAMDSGAAYVFVRQGASWSQQAYLKGPDPDPFDAFGSYLALHGERAIVSAIGEDSAARNVNGVFTDDSATDAGAAFVFDRHGTRWGWCAYLKASNPDPGDEFGSGVDLDGGTVLVSACRESSCAVGVNGIQGDNSHPWSGAAYTFTTFDVFSQETIRLGTPPNPGAFLPGTTTGPIVGRTWDPAVDHSSFASAATIDLLFVAPGSANLPTPVGTVLVDPATTLLAGPVYPVTQSHNVLALPCPRDCQLVGASISAQVVSIVGPGQVALTNAIDVVIGTR